MYSFFIISHQILAAFSLLATLIFAVMLLARPARKGFDGMLRAFYVLAMAVTGLAGLTGLAVTLLGPWIGYFFPWIGLGLLFVHGGAGTFAKHAFSVGNKLPASIAAGLQILALAIASGLMAAKPF